MRDKIEKIDCSIFASIFSDVNTLDEHRKKWLTQKSRSIYFFIALLFYGNIGIYFIEKYFGIPSSALFVFLATFVFAGMFVLTYRYNATHMLEYMSPVAGSPTRCEGMLKIMNGSSWAKEWRDMVLSQNRELMLADDKIMDSLSVAEIRYNLKLRGDQACKELHNLSKN